MSKSRLRPRRSGVSQLEVADMRLSLLCPSKPFVAFPELSGGGPLCVLYGWNQRLYGVYIINLVALFKTHSPQGCIYPLEDKWLRAFLMLDRNRMTLDSRFSREKEAF